MADLRPLLAAAPVMVSPYDAELFGHWWFEGPEFIEGVMRAAAVAPELDVVSGQHILAAEPVLQIATPSESSWGDNGYHGVWLNPQNDWVHPPTHGGRTNAPGRAVVCQPNTIAGPGAAANGARVTAGAE